MVTDGQFGLMPVYRDDPYTVEDEGPMPGDTVKVELSPYDLTRGRIVYRYK